MRGMSIDQAHDNKKVLTLLMISPEEGQRGKAGDEEQSCFLNSRSWPSMARRHLRGCFTSRFLMETSWFQGCESYAMRNGSTHGKRPQHLYGRKYSLGITPITDVEARFYDGLMQ